MIALARRTFFLIVFSCALFGQTDFYLKNGDTVVFYGDSITDQRLYTAFTEAYVLTRFPQLRVKFIHSGWGGDRVTGGGGGPVDVRLQRDVIAYKPTVMTIMLGMNDGRYKPFDADVLNTFTAGYENIVKTVRAALPNLRITAIQPSPYDDVTRAPLFEPGYNSVLIRYGHFLQELSKKDNLSVADLNTGVVDALRKANEADPQLAQKIIPDRVHPGAAGHLLMAEGLLKAWGAPAVVTSVEIDGEGGTAKPAIGTQVSALESAAGHVYWTQTDAALPMPIDWTDATVNLAIKSSDFVNALDQETLRVMGLHAGSYTLAIDGATIGTFSAGQLGDGVNLATLSTPMLKQAADVMQLTVLHNNIHFSRWRTVQFPTQKYSFTKTGAAADALDALEDEIVAAQRSAAQPKPHRYELTQVKQEP
jgi:lysophospholipase L1-like esterase